MTAEAPSTIGVDDQFPHARLLSSPNWYSLSQSSFLIFSLHALGREEAHFDVHLFHPGKWVEMTYAEELNKYFNAIERRMPPRLSGFIRWLRTPSSFWARLLVAVLLIVGGVFSFLPILGLWMLPLGLLLIAQDVPVVQRPLLAAFKWAEGKWAQIKAVWKSRVSDRKRSDQSKR